MKAKTAPPNTASFYQDNSQASHLDDVPKLEREQHAQSDSAYRHVKDTTAGKETVTMKSMESIKLVTVAWKDDAYDYDYTEEHKVDLGGKD